MHLYNTYGVCSMHTIYSTLQVFGSDLFLYCITPIWRGATSSQINFLESIQVCKPHTWHSGLESYTFLAMHPHIPHPRLVEVQWLGKFQWFTCIPFCAPITQALLHTPQPFYELRTTLGTSYMLIPQVF